MNVHYLKIKVIGISHIIPEAWKSWFKGELANGPWTWGDCDRSLVTAERFREFIYVGDRVDLETKDIEQFNKDLDYLIMDDVYIDLEH